MKDNENGADLKPEKKSLPLIIGDQNLNWEKQYILGREVKSLAGVSENVDVELFLAIEQPWEDELIADEDKVDLARPGIEKFYLKNILLLTINGTRYKWYEQYITGKQLKEVANISLDDEIYLSITKPWNDELIKNETIVDLARPEIEHFYSKEVTVEVKIVVNGREKSWIKKTISFEEIIVLAEGNVNNGNKAYTVTFLKGPKQNSEGEMGKGDVVYVSNKMIFNATATDKS